MMMMMMRVKIKKKIGRHEEKAGRAWEEGTGKVRKGTKSGKEEEEESKRGERRK